MARLVDWIEPRESGPGWGRWETESEQRKRRIGVAVAVVAVVAIVAVYVWIPPRHVGAVDAKVCMTPRGQAWVDGPWNSYPLESVPADLEPGPVPADQYERRLRANATYWVVHLPDGDLTIDSTFMASEIGWQWQSESLRPRGATCS